MITSYYVAEAETSKTFNVTSCLTVHFREHRVYDGGVRTISTKASVRVNLRQESVAVEYVYGEENPKLSKLPRTIAHLAETLTGATSLAGVLDQVSIWNQARIAENEIIGYPQK